MRVVLALLLFALAGCQRAPSSAPAPLAHEAYVWQQAWTPALVASLAGPAADGLAGWRVLVAEQLAGGRAPRWREVRPDWEALAAGGRPLTAVLRLDGQLAGDAAADDALRAAILARWQAAQRDAGRPLGLELDHDCGTRRLPAYAAFLRALRADLHARGGRLSITALPAWLGSRDALREVLAAVDAHVLQVHAVSRPERGLWNAAQTEAWLQDWAALAPHAFALALPAVGSRVRLAVDGTVLAVRSSAPAAPRDWPADSRELTLQPDPLALADFLVRLQAHRPARLRALVWFRWPLAGDANALTPDSWALLRRDPAAFAAASHAAALQWADEPAAPGLPSRRWLLANRAVVDLRLPAEVELPAGCEALAPLPGAQLASARRLRLLAAPTDVRLLPAGADLPVALVRCADSPSSPAAP
jgi:hypothetical protein